MYICFNKLIKMTNLLRCFKCIIIYYIFLFTFCHLQYSQCGIDTMKQPINSNECYLATVSNGQCCYGRFTNLKTNIDSTTCFKIEYKEKGEFKKAQQLIKQTFNMKLILECFSNKINKLKLLLILIWL